MWEACWRWRTIGAALACAVLGASGARAAITVTSDPAALAAAIESVPGTVVGAAFDALPASGTPHGVAAGTAALAGFPTSGTDFTILTSGNAALADTPNASGSTGQSNGGGAVRGDTDRDVSILRIDLDVPEGANCLTIDFRFLSDEFPEYVGGSVNDAFVAELDSSTWTTMGSVISAPSNFAFDTFGNVISINTAGPTSMTSGEALGTTYDGATPLLTASTPVTSGPHALYLSVFDQGDTVYDSAVFLDRLVIGTASPGGCEPGAKLCGNGLLDAGEECDDGNSSDGDCCDADCQYETAGDPCSDDDACSDGDACDGTGTCVSGGPLDCDDGNACTTDSCDAIGGCANDDQPASGCLAAGKSVLLIKNATDPGKDKLLWKWLKGAAIAPEAFGNPALESDYALCVYAGPASALVAGASLPPGPSWKPVGTKGFKFKGSSPNGLSLALLKSGGAGKSKVLTKGKGAALPDPTLPLAYPVTVQLRRAGSPLCVESTFSNIDEKKNVETQFKAIH